MKPDVERLLRIVAPALALVTACDAPKTPSAEVAEARTEASKTPEPEPKAVAKPEPQATPDAKPTADPTPTVDPTPEPRVEEDPKPTPTPVAVVKPTPKPPPPPEDMRVPPPERDPRPTCPSGSWCTDKKTAKKMARGKGEEMGCASNLGLKPGGPMPSGFPMNITGFSATATEAARDAGDADACCYAWYERCPGGRPLLDDASEPVVAKFGAGGAWTAEAFCVTGSPQAKAEAARGWLEDAAMEHASVASFGRVALELLELGAPPELIQGAHLAALDEIRHAQICVALAEGCGAAPAQPGPLRRVPHRAATLARFAADTFAEGCVGESTAALAVARAASGTGDAAMRGALVEISEDEERHAALAWRMVAWALAEGGDDVRTALQAEALKQRGRLTAGPPPTSAKPGADELRALGRLSIDQQRCARVDAWTGVVEPMLAALCDSRTSADPQAARA